jgi:hypothetical protein
MCHQGVGRAWLRQRTPGFDRRAEREHPGGDTCWSRWDGLTREATHSRVKTKDEGVGYPHWRRASDRASPQRSGLVGVRPPANRAEPARASAVAHAGAESVLARRGEGEHRIQVDRALRLLAVEGGSPLHRGRLVGAEVVSVWRSGWTISGAGTTFTRGHIHGRHPGRIGTAAAPRRSRQSTLGTWIPCRAVTPSCSSPSWGRGCSWPVSS